MALTNGVLVHGPTSWAVAIRRREREVPDGVGEKPLQAAKLRNPLLRGPARFAEIFALLPRVRAELPQARLPFERASVAASMAAGALLHRLRAREPAERGRPGGGRRRRSRLRARAARAPRRRELAAYHGAEHISIGSYEHDEPRAREHERCGTHLVGPLLVRPPCGNMIARAAPTQLRPTARVGGRDRRGRRGDGDLRLDVAPPRATRVARALARPGHEFQHRFATAEPTPRAARGRPGRAGRLPGARDRESPRMDRPTSTEPSLRPSGCPPRSSTCPSRRCGRATTRTRISTTPVPR